MANVYYSGQGKLYVAERNEVTGAAKGFIAVGNVPELTLNIETSKLEHKESESGQRLTDLTIVTEKKGSFEFKLENLDLENLALGLWGTSITVVGASVVDEVVPVPTAGGGRRYALAHPGVTLVVVKDSTGVTTYVVGTDYTVDGKNGTITIVSGGAIATAAASADINLKVSYTYAGYKKMDAFTQGSAPTRWLRFEGINTVDGTAVVIDLFKAQFDPATGYSLITEELASLAMKGSLLADSTKLTGSKFFRQINAG